mmetsp:Transcript_49702/g.127828  ORF Transcript_49702/g.127828 Transcript_49702/m.127828 type:complete len:263 (+) Transcript_49702:1581-2369(+)
MCVVEKQVSDVSNHLLHFPVLLHFTQVDDHLIFVSIITSFLSIILILAHLILILFITLFSFFCFFYFFYLFSFFFSFFYFVCFHFCLFFSFFHTRLFFRLHKILFFRLAFNFIALLFTNCPLLHFPILHYGWCRYTLIQRQTLLSRRSVVEKDYQHMQASFKKGFKLISRKQIREGYAPASSRIVVEYNVEQRVEELAGEGECGSCECFHPPIFHKPIFIWIIKHRGRAKGEHASKNFSPVRVKASAYLRHGLHSHSCFPYF